MAPKRKKGYDVVLTVKKKRMSPVEVAVQNITEGSLRHEDRFYSKFINRYKGRGVFTNQQIPKGDFLLQYIGEKISSIEGEMRLNIDTDAGCTGSFLFFVGKDGCIDATNSSGLGRLVNDSVKPSLANCKMKMVADYLCLFAVRDIDQDEELLYYYGPTDTNMYWRMGEEPSQYYEFDQECDDEETQKAVTEAQAVSESNNYQEELLKTDAQNVHESTPDNKITHTELHRNETLMTEVMQDVHGSTPDNEVTKVTETVLHGEERLMTESEDVHGSPPGNGVTKPTEKEIHHKEKLMTETTQNVCGSTPDNEVTKVAETELQCEEMLMTEATQDMYRSTSDNEVTKVTDTELHCEETLETESQDVHGSPPGNGVTKPTEKVMHCEDVFVTEAKQDVYGSTPDNEVTKVTELHCEETIMTETDTTQDIHGSTLDREMTKNTEKEMRCEETLIAEAMQDVHGSTPENESSVVVEADVLEEMEIDHDVSFGNDDDSRDVDFVPSTSDESSDDESSVGILACLDQVADQMDFLDDHPSSSSCGNQGTFGAGTRKCLDNTDDEDGIVTSTSSHIDSSSTSAASNISVSCASNTEGTRFWDKKNACFFCSELQTNLSRHLQRKHKTENEVAKAISYAKNSEERTRQWDRLRHLGNFYHNAKVKASGGVLIVAKRPSKDKKVSVSDYVPCVFCKGYYIAREMWRHYKDCDFRTDDLTVDADECRTITSVGNLKASRILGETQGNYNLQAEAQLFGSMRKDMVALICKTDKIISAFGIKLYLKKGQQNITHIRAKMREMGRLLLKLREDDDLQEGLALKDVLRPEKFDAVIEAVKAECRYSMLQGTPTFEIPSLALKMGHSLRRCCYIQLSYCIKEKDDDGEKAVEAFLKLLPMEFADRVSSIALQTINTQKQRKQQVLPLTADIVTFQSFIKKEVVNTATQLKQTDDEEYGRVFQCLAKASMARIITFNRRRSGEVSKILVSDFLDRQDRNTAENEDVAAMLCPSEQRLASRLELMNIRGKRGRTVPVIMTEEVITALMLLVDKKGRERAGISQTNHYVFPLARGSENCIRGCDALSVMVEKAGLQDPHAFKSTLLRKYIATVSQVLNMDENEMDWVANHLGHDIRVHRNYYRLRNDQVELAKVAKLLCAVDGGQAHQFHGKKLNEIQLNDLDQISGAGLSDEDDDAEDDVLPASDLPGQGTVEKDYMDESAIILQAEQTQSGNHGSVTRKVYTRETTPPVRQKISKKCCKHTPWSAAEMRVIYDEFKHAIRTNSMTGVGKKKCEELIERSGQILQRRTWIQVKSCVKNIIHRNSRLLQN